MRHKSLVFLAWVLITAPVFSNPSYDRYQAWLKTPDTWIRVGVKKPKKVLKLYSMNTLLVLDGRKVVQTIQPKGEFRIIVDQKTGSKAQHWVQLRAEKSATSLNNEKLTLETKYPDLNFAVMPSGAYQTLRAGPFNSQDRATRIKRLMQGNGFRDAFLVNLKAGRSFYWVNDRFDKFPLKANDLVLASSNPESPIRLEGTGYRGMLRLRFSNGKLQAINILPLETYLRGVVPSELGPKVFPEIEALKAQAVAARTYAIKNMGRFNRKGYDICDTPACQAYDGVKNEHDMSDVAVFETKGMVMYHEDTLIDALYTSTCGGQTDDVGNVFPGRNEPYLKGKTSYLATYSRWELPPRPTKSLELSAEEQDLQIKALLYGIGSLPAMDGALQAETLRDALEKLSWIFGKTPTLAGQGKLSHREFWDTLGRLAIVSDTVDQQVHASELEEIGRQYGLDPTFQRLAAFLLRFDLLPGAAPQRLAQETAISSREAFGHLMGLAEAFGPEPEWRRYRLAGMNGNQLTLRRNGRTRTLDLGRIRHYVTEIGGHLAFRDRAEVEASDNIYLVEKPFANIFLRLHHASKVNSVDRFSVFDSWVEKKSIETMEKRARRYVSQLRGLKDIRILERSDTGRVTLLELIADNGRYKVDGLRIRWSLGIRENLFNMLPTYKDGRLVHATFFGRGWGHGVGMSQVGAYGLAQMGWTYDEILKHYYDGVRLIPHEQKP